MARTNRYNPFACFRSPRFINHKAGIEAANEALTDAGFTPRNRDKALVKNIATNYDDIAVAAHAEIWK